MILYLFIFFVALILAILEILSNSKKFSNLFFTLIILIFFILSFIRWETGTDWEAYYNYFKTIEVPWNHIFDDNSGFELGYVILNHLAKSVSDSYTIMLLIEGIILYLFTYISIPKLSHYPIFSVLTFYSMSLGGIFFIRQTIAMSILTYSVVQIINKRKTTFIVLVILATLIHRTSIIFLLAYPIFYKQYSLKRILLLIFISITIGFIFSKLLLIFIGNLGLGFISAKINTYLDAGSEENYTTFSSTGVLIRGLINRSFLIFIYMYMLNKIRANDIILNGLINLNLFGMILYTILTPIAFSLGRLSAFFDILQIFILPYLFKNHSLRTKGSLLTLISIYLLFRLYTAVAAFPDAYIPYTTFFTY